MNRIVVRQTYSLRLVEDKNNVTKVVMDTVVGGPQENSERDHSYCIGGEAG